MRLFLLTVFVACASTAVLADQTDPRLDSLFVELRSGDAFSSEETVGRIIDIWSDAQSDTVDILYARALQSADEGDLDLALALLDHVVGLAPHFAQGFATRGMMRLTNQDQSGAVADFSKALELEPRQFEVRIALAEILLSNHEKRDAYEMFQKALEWNPHDDHARSRARALRRELDGQEI
ncbi:MAG TPA: tetratricopeptide repeat protein [Parvularculaceae bacterium]|nr:tetratricopeptide repeat protein [Amphiplicatus sp.]MCB9955583.1 tetratricopeptide repeat protein [Caulobacterales bacterium]HPE30668.1 tetratricopeptide repeat protein [Parvularculaceae bacterium]